MNQVSPYTPTIFDFVLIGTLWLLAFQPCPRFLRCTPSISSVHRNGENRYFNFSAHVSLLGVRNMINFFY